MPNIITIETKKKYKLNRSNHGEAIVRLDKDAADIVEDYLFKTGGHLTVKELVSSFVKYAANDTIIKIDCNGED